MRKQSLVHLHALCAQLRTHVEDRPGVSPEAFDRAEEVDVSPAAIYRRKESHRRAVQHHLADITAAIDHDRRGVDRTPAADGGPEQRVDED